VKNRLLVGVLVLMGVLFSVGGQACGPGRGCADPNASSVDLISVSVDPASGTGKFAMTVSYRWEYGGKGTIPKPARIECYYLEPSKDYVHVGAIDPAGDPSSYILDNAGWISGQSTLPFDVRPPFSPPPSGVYTALCEPEGYPESAQIKTPFTVTGGEAETTTTSEAAATTTSEAAATTTTQAAASAKWFIRIYNVDDHGAAYVNGKQVVKIDFGADSGWIDVTSSFSAPTTSVRFTMANDLQGYAWGFAVKRNDKIVWQDVQGEVNVEGANNNDFTRENQIVYDHTFVVSQSGQVTQVP
jgi:hypothetical protein